jgi:hypothetical protein
MEKMFIDNPWDDVERVIADCIEDWMVDADLMQQSRPEAERIARSIMGTLRRWRVPGRQTRVALLGYGFDRRLGWVAR